LIESVLIVYSGGTEMAYEFEYMIEEYLHSGAYLFGLIGNLFGSVINIALYVLSALGMYTIARRRGIHNPWLAWIPVANCWITGSISDQYRYVVKGQYKSKRKALLAMSIVQAVLVVAAVVLAGMMVFRVVNGIMFNISENQMMENLMIPAVGMALLCLPLMGVGIALCVVRYMAMYDLYTSCSPQNNVMFLVLSIVFHVTEPFFVFFNRHKDAGMPPRRETPQYHIPEPIPEPWETVNQE